MILFREEYGRNVAYLGASGNYAVPKLTAIGGLDGR